MKRPRITFALVVASALTILACGAIQSVHASDTVQMADGSQTTGDVVGMTKYIVSLRRDGATIEIPTNEIDTVRYESEPVSFRTARRHVEDGRYEDAMIILTTLNVDRDNLIRAELKQELDFYIAFCLGSQALTGQGDIREAGSTAITFLQRNTNNYRYLAVCELVGDLLVASQDYSTAQTYYAKLIDAPWPDYEMRANNAIGKAQLAQKLTTEARSSFQKVIDSTEEDVLAQREKAIAVLGQARCDIAENNPERAIANTQRVIDVTNTDETELLAVAYNTLGLALRKAGKPRDAVLAFLHVELLYFRSRSEYIESMQNLVELWNELSIPERANEAAATLRDRYGIR
jgi:tetratricopeptide (TPR) repeat protein